MDRCVDQVVATDSGAVQSNEASVPTANDGHKIAGILDRIGIARRGSAAEGVHQRCSERLCRPWLGHSGAQILNRASLISRIGKSSSALIRTR